MVISSNVPADSGILGAYALVIHIPVLFPLFIPSLQESVLAPGRYLYAGSAWGPGGIRARVSRHLKKDKSPHWHVDRLTNAFGVRDVLVFEGMKECALVEAFSARRGVEIPVPGFGSSDCKGCLSHLLKIPKKMDMEAFRMSLNFGEQLPRPQ